MRLVYGRGIMGLKFLLLGSSGCYGGRIMSSSYSRLATKFHDQLGRAIVPSRGSVVGPTDVRKVLVQMFPSTKDLIDWVEPTDHCVNHINKGACECAYSATALFERVGRGRFLVL